MGTVLCCLLCIPSGTNLHASLCFSSLCFLSFKNPFVMPWLLSNPVAALVRNPTARYKVGSEEEANLEP